MSRKILAKTRISTPDHPQGVEVPFYEDDFEAIYRALLADSDLSTLFFEFVEENRRAKSRQGEDVQFIPAPEESKIRDGIIGLISKQLPHATGYFYIFLEAALLRNGVKLDWGGLDG